MRDIGSCFGQAGACRRLWLTLLASLTITSAFAASSAGRETGPAGLEVGRTEVHACDTHHATSVTATLTEVSGGLARYTLILEGPARYYVETPTAALGLSLFREHRSEFGLDIIRQSFDERQLRLYSQFKPGTELRFESVISFFSKETPRSAEQRHDRQRWTHEVFVGERFLMQHPSLGGVEVVPVKEVRRRMNDLDLPAADEERTTLSLVSPEHWVVISSELPNRVFPEKCKLVEIRH